MFEGTVRDNLDPRHVHDDTELWSVLGHARLKEHIARMDGQLDAAIQEGGKSENITVILRDKSTDNSCNWQDQTLVKGSASSFLWRGLC